MNNYPEDYNEALENINDYSVHHENVGRKGTFLSPSGKVIHVDINARDEFEFLADNPTKFGLSKNTFDKFKVGSSGVVSPVKVKDKVVPQLYKKGFIFLRPEGSTLVVTGKNSAIQRRIALVGRTGKEFKKFQLVDTDTGSMKNKTKLQLKEM